MDYNGEMYGEEPIDSRTFVSSFDYNNYQYSCSNRTLQKIECLEKSCLSDLCGVPGFCPFLSAGTPCYCTKMWDCSMCSRSLAIVSLIVITLVAISIIICNCLIIIIMYMTRRSRSSSNLLKCSLACADLLTGILVVSSLIPNVIASMSSTGEEIFQTVTEKRNSFQSVAFGTMLVLSIAASVNQLVLMSLERLIVILCPFLRSENKKWKVRGAVGFTWVWSLFMTTIPLWFPHHFGYSMNVALQLYVPEIKPLANGAMIHGGLYATFLFFLPYGLTVAITVATAIVACKKLHGVRHMKCRTITATRNSDNVAECLKKKLCSMKMEIRIFKTTATMITGFTITLLPVAVVACLFYIGALGCSNYSTPYFICFYISLSNSFVNFIIYHWRDRKFRSYLRKVVNRLPNVERSVTSMTTRRATLVSN